MATTSSKLRSDHRKLSRSTSLGSPKPNADASNLKPSPNYLKPTISSRGDPVNPRSKRNVAHGLQDSQKLLRRRSFDPPPSSSSSPRLHKSLDISPLRPRHRPSLPREKPLTPLRSSSFHATRSSSPSTTKSPPVAPRGSKKSGLRNSSSSTKSLSKKAPHTHTSQESPCEEEKEVLKVATSEVQEEDKEEPATEAVHPDEPTEENKKIEETDTSPAVESPLVTETEEAVNNGKRSGAEEDNREEQKVNEADEAKEKAETTSEEDNQGNRAPEAGDISTDVATDTEVVTNVRESTTEQEKEGGKEIKEEESSDSKEEEASKMTTIAVSPDGPKRQVAQGKKESPTAYNDVIEKTAGKLLENRANKVKALVGAFETVIDYETAASK